MPTTIMLSRTSRCRTILVRGRGRSRRTFDFETWWETTWAQTSTSTLTRAIPWWASRFSIDLDLLRPVEGVAYETVNRALSQATTRQEALQPLDAIRQVLWVRPTTQLSGPLAKEVTSGAINLRYIP